MTTSYTDLPYRPCVGALILNPHGLIWIGRRYDAPSADAPVGRGTWWQMPQGGIDDGEPADAAVLREVQEETGMTSLQLLAQIDGSYLYDLPPELLAKKVWGGKYRGQRQAWFALRFTGPDSEVAITPVSGPKPEFDAWRWAQPAEVLDVIVPFKRDVYRAVLAQAAQQKLLNNV
jgi:putative (di)nucleoside polyphosphate hydrolase